MPLAARGFAVTSSPSCPGLPGGRRWPPAFAWGLGVRPWGQILAGQACPCGIPGADPGGRSRLCLAAQGCGGSAGSRSKWEISAPGLSHPPSTEDTPGEAAARPRGSQTSPRRAALLRRPRPPREPGLLGSEHEILRHLEPAAGFPTASRPPSPRRPADKHGEGARRSGTRGAGRPPASPASPPAGGSRFPALCRRQGK